MAEYGVSSARREDWKVLAIITARSGSKGIPRKNLAPLAGMPLIQYTFEAALASRELDRVVLSTDDPEIAECGRAAGVMVPFLRPSDLASDTALSEPVVEHAVSWLEQHAGCSSEAVMLLQPTSPLRHSRHIDEAIELFRSQDTEGVVGVSEVAEHPYSTVSFSEGNMRRAIERPPGSVRRQDLPQYFHINGAIYLVVTRVLMERHTMVPTRCLPYLMDRRYSLDIDSPLDLHIAESLLGLPADR